MLHDPTVQKLRALGLTAMAGAWLAQQQRADLASLSFDERFGLIVDAEYLARENRRLTRRLSDDATKRGLDKSLLRQLGSGRWIAEHLNIVITGATGVGKTYLACAFGQQACRSGYRVIYRRTPRLIDELTLARADGTLARLLGRLARVDLLLLDDWGITPLRDHDRRDLLEVIEDRDGLRSTLLASQIPIANWHDYLGDPTIADTIADRLLHNAHRLVLKGPSRRKRRTEEVRTDD
jgi:DNA replication protein DnaC